MHFTSNKHLMSNQKLKYGNFLLRKRLAEFAPDFSIESEAVERLAKSIEHVRECEARSETPGFCLG